jgi:Polyketide cyclase / dehydrase and lipid transport
MAANEYHFVTTWRLEATAEEVTAILGDAEGLARWWPSVYLDVEREEPGDARGVGAVVRLYTKGWLPYTLRWRFTVTESDPPRGFSLEASGDFLGRGIWTFEQVGTETLATYDWLILAEKGILRRLSFIMKPVFGANHHWAMARGEESLRLELARRRATTLDARMRIPKPPGPTFPHNLRGRSDRRG